MCLVTMVIMLTPILLLLACQPSLMLGNDIEELEDGATVRYPDKTYTLVKQMKTWTEAKTFCKTHYSGLCVIHTERDWNDSKAALEHVSEPVWIGLHRNPNNPWQWSNGEDYFYLNWNYGVDQCSPIDTTAADQSAYHSSRWNWRVYQDTLPGYVCQKVTHDNGATVKTYNIHYSSWKTHKDAVEQCKKQGGDLASITNQKEQDALDRVYGSDNHRWYWIGLKCKPLRWSSGEPFPPLDEIHMTGPENCMTMKADGKLKTENCESEKAFLCYGEQHTADDTTDDLTTAVTTDTPSTETLTTPAPPSTSTETLTTPAPPSTSTETLTTPAPPSTSTETLTTPAPPSTSTETLTTPAAPSTSTETLTTPAPPSTSTETLTTPAPPSTSTETLTTPAPPSTSTPKKGNLHFYAERKDWVDALRFCMDHGGSLVHITNNTVQEEVVQLLTDLPAGVWEGGAWIGMERNIFGWESPWEWDWVSGERVDNLGDHRHGHFPADIYSHHCGKIIKEKHNYTWLDDCCCRMRPFICQGGEHCAA